ncbi:MAG: TonB-dependent receptor plug domain-containing protein [Longimicrobiaceae bacterium]
MRQRTIFALAGLLLTVGGAAAQEAGDSTALSERVIPLDSLVVTVSRRPQRLADVPVATELISRREIERTGASDLAAVLIERAGIVLEGGHPTGAGVMLQGMGSERVLVLVDGQPFIGRISGKVDLSRIPASMIERIEVVKGPQSTLYGSEAMGGVVNVITRRTSGDAWNVGAELRAGSQHRRDASAHLSGGAGPASWVLELGRRGVSVTPGQAEAAGARAERWDGLAKLHWTVGPSLALEASALVLDERQRWRSGQLWYFADNRQWSARLGADWARGEHRLSPTLYATEFDHLSRRANASEPVEGTGERQVQRLFEAELLYTGLVSGETLDAGIEVVREEIDSDRVLGEARVLHSVEPFAQITIGGAGWSVVPGMRLSWSEQWGAHWTPRLAILYRAARSLALRASVGRGYRAPAFKELYLDFLNIGPGYGYAVRGNPDLRPETSTNLTLGAEWAGEGVYLRGQLFGNRFDDFIETRLAGDSSGITLYTYGNLEDGQTWGSEVEAGAALGGLIAEGGYSYLVAHAADGRPLLGRPMHSARASFTYAWPFGLRASATGLYTGETPIEWEASEAGFELRERGGFTRFDLRMAQELPYGLEVAFGVDNVLDSRPEKWPGYAGRHLYIGLELQTSTEEW